MLCMVTPAGIVSLTPGLTFHRSPKTIVWSAVIVVSVVNVIEAASAGWAGKSKNMANAPRVKAVKAIIANLGICVI